MCHIIIVNTLTYASQKLQLRGTINIKTK
uniref:Uncharacterized protein n=1 Tax=Anguilla anguilla TaxID=7936 RepID=A0A0E9Q527_ANGAN